MSRPLDGVKVKESRMEVGKGQNEVSDSNGKEEGREREEMEESKRVEG